MAHIPRNITPQLSRATVTIRELASLGWLPATIARLHSTLGIGWRRESDESNGESFEIGHESRHRLDTSSLKVEAEWPKALIKLGIGAVTAVAMITTLTLAEPAPEVPAAPAAVPVEQVLLTPTTLPDTDEPSVKAEANPKLDKTPKAHKRSHKKRNRKAQKRRSR